MPDCDFVNSAALCFIGAWERIVEASRDKHLESWWQDWRAADWSWRGLLAKPWPGWFVEPDGTTLPEGQQSDGARKANLQDYWRDESNHLIEGDGEQWTRLHTPMRWADGTAAKAKWSEEQFAGLDAMVAKALRDAGAASHSGPIENRKLVGADRRASLNGGVFRLEPALALLEESAQLNMYCNSSFIDDARVAKRIFASGAAFADCWFVSPAVFEGCQFLAHAAFKGSHFDSGLVVRDVARVVGALELGGATCRGPFALVRARFAGPVVLDVLRSFQNTGILDCHFEQPVSFRETELCGPSTVTNSIFEKGADFSGMKLLPLDEDLQTIVRDRKSASEYIISSLLGDGSDALEDTQLDAGESISVAKGDKAATPVSQYLVDQEFFANAQSVWSDVTFGDEAIFIELASGVPLDMRGMHFKSDANFSSARFQKHFLLRESQTRKSRSDGLTSFSRSTFDGPAGMLNVEFAGAAEFELAKFTDIVEVLGVSFDASTSFHGTSFGVKSTFHAVRFGGDVVFWEGVCADRFSVNECDFLQHASFSGRRFHGPVSFEDSRFHGLVRFEHCYFGQKADFSRAMISNEPIHFSDAFRGAKFDGAADFLDAPARWMSAFNDAILERSVLFRGTDERSANREFRHNILPKAIALRGDPKEAIEEETERRKKAESANPGPLRDWERRAIRLTALNKGLRELEGGCRALKLAAARDRKEDLEQRYYRFQIIARQHQRGISGWLKISSVLYGATSDYGASILRPLCWLVFVLVAFAGAFFNWAWLNGFADWRSMSDLVEALEFSVGNVFRPLSAFLPETVHVDSLGGKLLGQEPINALGVRLLASLESVLALLLVFLTAVAVRRRFQIS